MESPAGGFLERADSAASASDTLGGGGLLRDLEVAGLILLWCILWVIMHFVAWPFWKAMPLRSESITQIEVYRRRLCRSQVYCGACVIAFVWVFSRWRNFPHDLLYDFSWLHQVLYTMCSAHWFVSIWEDYRGSEYIKAGLDKADLRVHVYSLNLQIFLLHAYTIHHLIAGLGFAAITFHKACTGVAAFGLIFELPVLLLNHREFMVLADMPPAWWNEAEHVDAYWSCTIVTFLVARFSPGVVYLYSLYAWRDGLNELDSTQTFIYHFMAIFFVLLNHQFFVIVMQGWYRHDLRRVGVATKPQFGIAKDAPTSALVNEDTRPIDESVIPLGRVLPATLEAMDGKDSDTMTWMEIDGIVYDVTNFLDEHPGGKAVLKKYAGMDATEAFRKIGHSQSAQVRMQGLAVGPLASPLDHYRIFEHPEEMIWVCAEGGGITVSLWLLEVFLGNSVLPKLAGAPHQGLVKAVLPGCIMAVSGAAGSALLLTLAMMWRSLRPSLCWIGYGITLNMMYAGLNLVRCPLPAALLATGCPTGVELSAAAIWLLEELLQAQRLDTRSLLGMVAVSLSWRQRRVQALVEEAPEHILAAVLIALSLAWLARRVSGLRGRLEIALEFFGGVIVAGIMGGAALWSYGPADVSQADVFDYVLALPLWDLIMLAGACLFQTFVLGMLLNTAHDFSAPWVTRCVAYLFALGAFLAGGLGGGRWLWVVGVVLHLAALAGRQRIYLSNASANGTFSKVPAYTLGTQSMWDGVRTLVPTLLWRVVVGLLRRLLQFILPQELTVFALDRPLMNLGPDVDLGVAAHFQPVHVKEAARRDDLEDPYKPGYIVCNVGHISHGHATGLSDMQRTMNALRDVWSEFKNPEVSGLISNVVCVFPEIQGTSFAKEINLSTWTSQKEVNEWYVQSRGHRDILMENNSGYLRTFGSLLASMAPVREVRHQDRCSRCARVVESPQVGKKAPSRCPYCNAKTFGYPYI